MELLTREQREAIELVYQRDMTMKESLGVVGTPPRGPVKARVRRGLEALRQALATGSKPNGRSRSRSGSVEPCS